MAINRLQPSQVLAAIAGTAPRRAPNVRTLASFASVSDCNLAALGFAAGVDFDRLLSRTNLAVPFGQSPFAFARGRNFERMLAEGGFGVVLALLREHMGFDTADARVVSLRDGYPANRRGMILRANQTRHLLAHIANCHPDAPNLIDGAVLTAAIGGVTAHFEADALAARFGGTIHVGEVKSFPIIDERADPDKLGPAMDQAALYIILARRAIADQGADPNLVATEMMLIAPHNVGMRPTLARKDVSQRIARMEQLIDRVPSQHEIAALVLPGADFGAIADTDLREVDRINRLHTLADSVGTKYCANCLASCGLSRFCRARAHSDGSPQVAGAQIVRLMPQVQTLDRAAELADGAPPSAAEVPVAAQLERAARLYDSRFIGMPLRAASGGTQ